MDNDCDLPASNGFKNENCNSLDLKTAILSYITNTNQLIPKIKNKCSAIVEQWLLYYIISEYYFTNYNS